MSNSVIVTKDYPIGWKKTRLGEVCSHIKGFAFKSSDYRDSGRRLIRISDISRDTISNEKSVYIDKRIADLNSKHRLNKGDIIVTSVGSRPPLLSSMVGKVIKIPENYSESLLNQNMVKLIPKNDLIDQNYLFSSLSAHDFIIHIIKIVTGNANQVSISLKDLFNYQFYLPPLSEQQKIAQILSTWDEAIAKTEQLIAALEQRKKGLMQRLLTGKVRFPEFSDSWISAKLKDVAIIIMGQSPSSTAYNNSEIGLPLIQGNSDIRLGFSSPRFFTSEYSKVCEIGDILLSVRAPVGETAISNHVACLGRGVAAVQGTNIDHRFLYHLMKHNEWLWQKYAQGSTFSAINSNDIKGFSLFIPESRGEQEKIARLLDLCDKELSSIKNMLYGFSIEKKGIMQRLLTGQVRVKVEE